MHVTTNYQDVFDHANDAIFIHDNTTGTILDANRMAANLTGYSVAQLRQMTVGDISSRRRGFDDAGAVALLQRTIHEGPQLFEWWLCRPDGSDVPVAGWASMLLDGVDSDGTALCRDRSPYL